MYSLGDYGGMIGDAVRTPAYVRAIEAAVRPGSVVVDLGCGTGFFALVACRAGAQRVYAIEQAEIIQFAEKLAAVNGFSDRITFLRGDSRQMQLRERADLIVSDLPGALGDKRCSTAVSYRWWSNNSAARRSIRRDCGGRSGLRED